MQITAGTEAIENISDAKPGFIILNLKTHSGIIF